MRYLVINMTRAAKSPTRFIDVPKDADPIAYLLANGYDVPRIAAGWRVTPDAVYKLRQGAFVPRATTTGQRIAYSIGWELGEVIEHFANKVTG